MKRKLPGGMENKKILKVSGIAYDVRKAVYQQGVVWARVGKYSNNSDSFVLHITYRSYSIEPIEVSTNAT